MTITTGAGGGGGGGVGWGQVGSVAGFLSTVQQVLKSAAAGRGKEVGRALESAPEQNNSGAAHQHRDGRPTVVCLCSASYTSVAPRQCLPALWPLRAPQRGGGHDESTRLAVAPPLRTQHCT